jgi:hypothetical protein
MRMHKVTMIDKLRQNPLYRETRTSLEYSSQTMEQDQHLFEVWTMLLALEDHINSTVSETHVEHMLAKQARNATVKTCR